MNIPLNRKRQAGVGVIEIMVGMAISLVLLAGLVQIFISQKQGFLVQESQSRLQENARLASMILYSTIAKAGFYANPEEILEPDKTVFVVTPVLGGTNGSGNNPDTITVRFQGADQNGDGIGDVADCLGTIVPISSICINRFQITGTELECVSTSCGNNQTQPLIDNVENLQILYGETTDTDDSVDRYVTNPNFNNVRSVHVALLMASEGNVLPHDQAKRDTNGNLKTYTLLDAPPVPDSGDLRQRRIVERVIALRNRIP